MFAALMVVRLKEACLKAGLLQTNSWVSGDEVAATELPLAKATQKVLSSMQMVLERTVVGRDQEMGKKRGGGGVVDSSGEADEDATRTRYLAETKAAEVRVVRNVGALWEPEERYHAVELEGLISI